MLSTPQITQTTAQKAAVIHLAIPRGETLLAMLLSETRGVTTLTKTLLHFSSQARDGALMSGMTEGAQAGYGMLDELAALLVGSA